MNSNTFCILTIKAITSRAYDHDILLAAIRLLMADTPGDNFPSKPEDYATYLIQRVRGL